VTDVKKKDLDSAVEVVEQCYVGDDPGGLDATRGAQRSINMHTLLDNTGSCESQCRFRKYLSLIQEKLLIC
jgi:hypothetical protein